MKIKKNFSSFRSNEIREKTEKLQDEIGNLDMDIEEHHGNFLISSYKNQKIER